MEFVGVVRHFVRVSGCGVGVFADSVARFIELLVRTPSVHSCMLLALLPQLYNLSLILVALRSLRIIYIVTDSLGLKF